MSKRLTLSERQIRIIGLSLEFVIKDSKYTSALAAKIGTEEILDILKHLGLEIKEKQENTGSKQ